MNVLSLLRRRFSSALEGLVESEDDRVALAEMVRPSQDPRFGDYQANCAMPLGKRLGKSPRDVAADLIATLQIDDCCEEPEIAGPGFINLRLRTNWLERELDTAWSDLERLGVERVAAPRQVVIDYSSPNVAKPMHVGHIRSTVIGDALYRLLSFLGDNVVSDNHIGDWGTQFGMILYGFKNFADQEAYHQDAVAELGRLYRLVQKIAEFQDLRDTGVPNLERAVAQQDKELAKLRSTEDVNDKKFAKKLKKAEARCAELRRNHAEAREKLDSLLEDRKLATLVEQHPNIGEQALAETASLHAGDPENLRLWREFLPPCMQEIEATYQRLGVEFDHTLGESFYHSELPRVVENLLEKGLARESEGAICIFLQGHDVPMIVRKQDGAFLYATTDLATIDYRVRELHANTMLYVVDHRQSLHFAQLFDAARAWGYQDVDFEHVSFGTVLGEDGRPFKTRSGDTVGLTSLLDEAVAKALVLVSENDDRRESPLLSAAERQEVAEQVGIGALKYADLVHNRSSDYVFSYEKMLAMNGNTATYMQYAYARVRSIFMRGNIDPASLRENCQESPDGAMSGCFSLIHDAERRLGLELLRFPESLAQAADEYRPNYLTSYLFSLAEAFSTFYEACPVLKAEAEATRAYRLRLSDLTARILRKGLELLGIDVPDKM